jgi:hypothetical protein
MVLLISSSLVAAQSAVPFRKLSSHESGSAQTVKEFDYNVSVDQYLDVAAAKNVICRLILNEKPLVYDILSAGIYYKLDRYISESDGDVADAAELRNRRIAQYHWNKDSPKDSRRLVLTKDAKGQTLREWRFYDFDHTKTCK